MALAETAQLIVDLRLRDNLTGPLARARAAVGTSSTTIARGANRISGAFANAGAAVGGFVRGPLGLLTGGAAALGAVRFLSDATQKAEDFGRASTDLAKLLDLPIEQASRLTDTLDKFGIETDQQIKVLGRLNKNAQTLAGTAKKSAKFTAEFGFSLTDANGAIVDANELLKRSADFFNGSATAAQKATLLTKLYGREWATLIPLLSKGRQGIEEEERGALTLTKAQIDNLVKLREAQRELNDEWGDTQTLIGLELAPAFTKLARGLNEFLSTNRQGITDFFKGAAGFASELGSAINQYVLPGFKAIGDVWNGIPGDMRKLLIAGFIGNKALKMTIGFDPIDIARKGITDTLFRRGGTPGTPMFVKEVGLGGAVGAAGKGGGILAGAGKVIGAVAIVGGALAIWETWRAQNERSTAAGNELQRKANDWLSRNPSRADLDRGLGGVEQGIRDIRSNPLLVLVQGEALAKLEAIRNAILGQRLNLIMSTPDFQQWRNREQSGSPVIPTRPRSSGGGVTNTPGYQDHRRREQQGTVIVNTSVSTDHRQNSSAASVQTRYGPTPAMTGAA